MAPNRLQDQKMGDAIYEFQLNDQVYRLNTNVQLKVVSRKAEPQQKILRQVNEAIFKELPDKRKASPLPDEYIQYNGKEVETDEEAIEYDIDDEDLVWLDLINDRRKKEKLKPISEKLLEHGIDRFEKASYFQNTDATRAPIDNDAICCICMDGDDSNVNQIIFCDMCNLSVHQECYGVPYIPAGQWLCRRCQLSPSEPVKCVFCPYQGGAFKQTSDNHWAHVVCALWLSEVHFANAVFLEPVEGVAFSLKRRCKLTCGVCRIKMGACLQCSKKSCVRPFHVTCAIFAEMHMKVETQDKDGSGETIVNRFAFCHHHSALINKTMPPTMAAFKRQTQEKVKKARRILQSANSQSLQVAVPVISAKKLEDIKEELKMDKMEDLLAYWSMKRRSRCGVPLIRRLQVYTSRKQLGRRSHEGLLDDGGPNPMGDVIPTQGLNKEVANQLYRTGKLRNNLEKLRLLIELTKKREKYKLEMIENYREIIENTLKPPQEILEGVLEKLIEKDHQKVFINPVNEDEVPGYRKIIKKPMDFSKMRSKLHSGEYKKVSDLRVDFQLMMDNCALFNKDNMYFWRYGHQMRSLGLKVLKSAEQDEQISSSGKLMGELIPVVFEEEEIDSEMKTFLDQYSATVAANEKAENKKRKLSNASNRRRSIADQSGLKDTKILDYFKPKDSPVPSPKQPQSPSRQRGRKNPAQTPSGTDAKKQRLNPTPQSRRSTNQQKAGPSGNTSISNFFQQTRTASGARFQFASDDSSDEASSSSPDEEFVADRRQKRSGPKPKSTGKQSKTPVSKQKSSPRQNADNHSEFAHDDIVWAPLKAGYERMPGRVFDRSMIALEENRQIVDKVQKLQAQSTTHQLLIVFFDSEKTVKYVPIGDLEHCDVSQKLSKSEPSHAISAFKRAKEFWDEYTMEE